MGGKRRRKENAKEVKVGSKGVRKKKKKRPLRVRVCEKKHYEPKTLSWG
jgi:hypothetical protein